MTHASLEKSARLRRAQMATIHVARQQLSMDDDAYRDMLARVSSEHGRTVRSSAHLTSRQRTAVIEELRRLGAARPVGKRKAARYPGKPHNAESGLLPEMITKVEALLTSMRLPWAYADAIAKQQLGIDKVAWVRQPAQMKGIIGALHVEQEKRSLGEAIDQEVRRLGWNAARFEAMTSELPGSWRRQRRLLRKVLDDLAELTTGATGG